MELVISVTDSARTETMDETLNLYSLLRETVELRNGTKLCDSRPSENEMGGTVDSIVYTAGSSLLLRYAVQAIITWIQSRRVVLTIERGKTKLQLDGPLGLNADEAADLVDRISEALSGPSSD